MAAVSWSNTGYKMDTHHRKPSSRPEARESIAYSRSDTIYKRDVYHKMSDVPSTARKAESCPRCGTVYNERTYYRTSDARRAARAEKVCRLCGLIYDKDIDHRMPGVYCETKEEAPYPQPGAGEVTLGPETGNGSATGTRPPPFSGPKIGGAQPLCVASCDPSFEGDRHDGHMNYDMICKANIYDAAQMNLHALPEIDLRSPHDAAWVYGQGATESRQAYYVEPPPIPLSFATEAHIDRNEATVSRTGSLPAHVNTLMPRTSRIKAI